MIKRRMTKSDVAALVLADDTLPRGHSAIIDLKEKPRRSGADSRLRAKIQ
jgi:hypothetical protein